jgi:hypothetical protein
MQNRSTKTKAVLIIMLAWLIAFALLYTVLIKLKILFH